MLALRGRDKGITSRFLPAVHCVRTRSKSSRVSRARHTAAPSAGGGGRASGLRWARALRRSHDPVSGRGLSVPSLSPEDWRGDPARRGRRPLPQPRQVPTGPRPARRQMGAGAALTRQRLLRPRQQHSRRPPAPSSAAALASAAATNRPSGAADQHDRRRPATERPARPGGSAGAGSGAAAARAPGLPAETRVRGPRRWHLRQPELAGPGRGRRGFVIVNSALPPQSTPGNSRPGEGRSGRLRKPGSR